VIAGPELTRLDGGTEPSRLVADVLASLERDGGVIVHDMISAAVLATLRADMELAAARLHAGTRASDESVARFWGATTKRFTRLAMRSASFTDLLLHPVLLGVADALLLPHCHQYWMNTGQMMIIGPGERAQYLHRDADNWAAINRPGGMEVTVSCMFALSDFTADLGATRVVPGSHRWSDYTRRAVDDEVVAAVMPAGSGLLYTGRVLHGGGANVTTDEWRFGLHLSFVLGWLTPEEAGPLGTPWEVARELPARAQQLLGWRCYPATDRDPSRLWTADYEDLPVALDLS